MGTVLILHVAIAAVAAALATRIGAKAMYVASLAPALTAAWAASNAASVLDGTARVEQTTWVESLHLTWGFRLDAFGLLMCLVVGVGGVAVFVYAAEYFAGHEPAGGFVRLIAALTVFAGAMAGLVVADDVLTVFVCWELTTVCSYILIGIDDTLSSARAAAQQALLTTGLGGLALLGGLVLIGQASGTWQLSAWLAATPTGTAVTVGAALCLLGAATKSAQAPFHTWLPGAMAAPTPISAYLHSATMVKAGLVLVARLAPILAGSIPWWTPTVAIVGATTMVVGGVRALRQNDLKLVLAHGTVSQLGFMFVLIGCGRPELTAAGVAVLLAHALFKATLFMVVGAIDHGTGTRDLRRLGGLRTEMPVLAVVAAVAGASMAGIPPLFGFVAKELGLDALVHEDGLPWWLLTAVIVLGSALTVAYTCRFWFGAFGGSGAEPRHVHQPAAPLVVPGVVLATATAVLGVAPRLVDHLLAEATIALDPTAHPHHLALWHGFTVPLLLSAIAIGVGVVIHLARPAGLAELGARVPSAQAGYDRLAGSIVPAARTVAGVAQPGSLPLYVAICALVTLVTPMIALATSPMPVWPVVAESPVQVALVAALSIGAVATAFARKRFTAAVLLGAVGYSTAALYVLQGAPDLALTQVLVETLTVIIFVLVLRHLPEAVPHVRLRGAAVAKGVVAVVCGLAAAAFVVVAGANRTAPTPTDDYVAAAADHGSDNVVNLILVDLRGGDTMGEISVLVVTGLGVIALATARKRVNDRAT